MNTFSSSAPGTIKTIVAGIATLLWPTAASAQLQVLISGGFSGAYEQLLPEFERETDIKVTTGSGSSQGAGPQTIGAQLARGVPADVVILSREGLNELIAANGSRPARTLILRERRSAWRCVRERRSRT
jgi:molybdate transport system substrate-binding protein